MNKPAPLKINGEIFQILEPSAEEIKLIGMWTAVVYGAHMNLNPYEAEQLRDWLTKYLEWYYETKNSI